MFFSWGLSLVFGPLFVGFKMFILLFFSVLPHFQVLVCIKSLPQKYLSHIHKAIYIKSSFLSVLNLSWFESCSCDFSPLPSWQVNMNITIVLGQCMDSHGVFLQNMISILHRLLSSLFLPQDIRQYSYHHIHWTLLFFLCSSPFPDFNLRISSRTCFLVKSHEHVDFIFCHNYCGFVPILHFFHVSFYSTWKNTQKETCNVFQIFFLFPFMIHQFFYDSVHISHYKHVAIKKKINYVSRWICWLSIFCWIFLSGYLSKFIFLPIVALDTDIFWQLWKIYFQNTFFFRLTYFNSALWQKVLDLWKVTF